MDSIKDYLETIKQREPSKRIHSRHQDLAVQIATDFGDMKNIGIYMRICKQFDDSYVRRIWSTVKEIRPINPGKYFVKCVFNKNIVHN